MIRLRAFILLFLFVATTRAWAAEAPEPALQLTVEQAVRLAIEQNRDVRKAREQVDALRGKIREVKSQAFPQVKLEGGMLRFRDPSFLNSSSFDKIPPEFKNALTADPANLFNYGVSVSQPLYTAGKVGTAVRLANLEAEGVEADRDAVEQTVCFEVVRAFYDLLLAEERVTVARETVEQRRKHLEVVKSRFEAGDATEVDVLRSQVNLANAEPDLIRARNAIEQARGVLNQLLVRDPRAPLEARGQFDFQPWTESDFEVLSAEAIRRRPELARLRITDRESEQQQRLAEAESRMRVDFKSYFGISSRLLENLGNRNFERWNFSFDFSLPVYDGGRRSGLITQSVSARRMARLALEQQESAVRLQVQQAADEIRRAEKTVEATQLNVTQAERVLEMMQNNYKYGAATTLDVVDAQTALTWSRTNLLQGLYDHVIGKARLRWVLGRPVLPPQGGIHP